MAHDPYSDHDREVVASAVDQRAPRDHPSSMQRLAKSREDLEVKVVRLVLVAPAAPMEKQVLVEKVPLERKVARMPQGEVHLMLDDLAMPDDLEMPDDLADLGRTGQKEIITKPNQVRRMVPTRHLVLNDLPFAIINKPMQISDLIIPIAIIPIA